MYWTLIDHKKAQTNYITEMSVMCLLSDEQYCKEWQETGKWKVDKRGQRSPQSDSVLITLDWFSTEYVGMCGHIFIFLVSVQEILQTAKT